MKEDGSFAGGINGLKANSGAGSAGHVHVSDGMIYTSMPPQYRCKICGEFKTQETAPPITWN